MGNCDYNRILMLIEDAKIYQKQELYEEAIKRLNEATEELKYNDNYNLYGPEVYKLLCFNYRKSLKFIDAENCIKLSIEISRKNLLKLRCEKYIKELGIGYMNYGVVLEQQEKYIEAEDIYKLAIILFKELVKINSEEYGILINSNINLGMILYKQKKYIEAREVFKKSIKLFKHETKNNDERYFYIIKYLDTINNELEK